MPLYGNINIPGQPDYENLRKLDQLPIPMIRRMMRYGIAVDIPYLHGLSSRLEKEMDELRLDIACEIPPEDLDAFVARSGEIDDWSPINVESGQQLAELLFNSLNIGKGKDLKKTKGGDRLSTGKKQLELLKKDHPVIGLILKYRERSKLRNTYTTALPKIARFHPQGRNCILCGLDHKADSWRVHTEILTTRTDTGRLASKKPNLQNIPARTELGRLVRAAFIPTPGYVFVAEDYAQIELRLLAHCSRDPAMIAAFRSGRDIHMATACNTFGLDYDYWMALSKRVKSPTCSKEEKKAWGNFALTKRAPCKNVNFGIVYGLTETGLFDNMALTYATAGLDLPPEMTVEWCRDFIGDWFGLYQQVQPYMHLQHYRSRRYGCVWDELGRTRAVPEVKSVHRWIESAGLRQSGNMPIQSMAAGVMKIGMARVEDKILLPLLGEGVWVWPLLPIHDELLVEVEEEYAEYVEERVGEEFSLSMVDEKGRNHCRVPIGSDGKVMTRWVKE